MNTYQFTIITGASSGFGKALALECGSRKMNLILIDLPGTGLRPLATYIERSYDVRSVCFEFDLTDPETYSQLFYELEVRGMTATVLINNAGIGGTHLFSEKGTDYYERQIKLNVTAPTLLSHFFIRHGKREEPVYILNVCSLAGFFALPRKQVYGGTKSYLVKFSSSLRKELKDQNIYVSAVCPGGMNTSPLQYLLNQTAGPFGRWATMNPEDVAKVALDGLFRKKEIIVPGLLNRSFLFLNKILPSFVRNGLSGMAMKKLSPISAVSPALHRQF